MINIDSFIEDLKCSICLEIFNDPRTLNCQHSFCTKCLEPMIADKVFNCPQCRVTVVYDNINKVPKNIIISSLINNLNSTKASCPDCKKIQDLTICDHCSQIFCHKCLEQHVRNLFTNIENKINVVETLPVMIENIKSTLNGCETSSTIKICEQMDQAKVKIVSLFENRKLEFLNETRKFYKLKKEELEIAHFRLKSDSVIIKQLNAKKCELEKKLNNVSVQGESFKNEKKLFKQLAELEKETASLEYKYRETCGNLSNQNDRLVFKYNEIETIQLYESLLKNTFLITKENKGENLADVCVSELLNIKENEKKIMIPVNGYFGKKMQIELDVEEKLSTIEDLKEKLKFMLGVESKYISFINGNDAKQLQDKCELIVKNGKIFVCNNQQQQNEIQLYVSYKYEKNQDSK